MRILAVEDSASARKVLQGVLTGLGVDVADVRLASDAAEAMRVATEWSPEVVFLDMDLQGPADGAADPPGAAVTSGDGLGRAILRRSPRTPVVMVTALDRDDPRVKALLKDGAADVIMKPVRAARVQEVLQRLGFLRGGPGSRGRGDPRPPQGRGPG
jgi:CheY-like chemotaxis protein